MNASLLSRDELYHALESLCDELLSPADVARLDATLAEDVEARRTYREFFGLHALVECNLRKPSWKLSDTSADLPGKAWVAALQSEARPSSKQGHEVDIAQPLLRRIRAALVRPAVWSTLAATVLFASYFIAISWNMWGRANPHGDGVATIRASNEAVWSKNSAAKSSAEAVASGERLKITSGVVRLQLKQGVLLSVHGPAEWSVDDANVATVTLGRFVAKVPPQAVGFILNTPLAKIVDLGTEFGIEVSKNGKEEVHVLKGVVDVQNTAIDASSDTRRLTAGRSVRITAAGVTTSNNSEIADRLAQLSEENAAQVEFPGMALIDLKARGKATHSTKLNEFGSELAIDGKLETYSCTAVADVQPWCQVELDRPTKIAAVVLKNRQDAGKGRTRDLSVVILGEDGNSEVWRSKPLNPENKLGGSVTDFNKGPSEIAVDVNRLAGSPVLGKFVRVERTPLKVGRRMKPRIKTDRTVLNLAEIQLYEVSDKQSGTD